VCESNINLALFVLLKTESFHQLKRALITIEDISAILLN